jgi:hypothetical protein
MHWKLRCLGLILGLSLSASAAAEQTAPLEIAGGVLQFPLDPSYQSVRSAAPRVFEILSTSQPQGLRLVDAFYSESDLKRTVLGLGAPEQGVFSVQVLRDSEGMRVSEKEWAEGKPIMVRAMGDLDMNALAKKYSQQASDNLSKLTSTPVTLSLNLTTRPKIYWTEGDSLRFLMLIPVKGQVGSEELSGTLAAAGAVVRIQEKMVYVYLYHDYKDEQSVRDLQTRFDQFLLRFFAANAEPVAAPAPVPAAVNAAPNDDSNAASGAPAKAEKAPD